MRYIFWITSLKRSSNNHKCSLDVITFIFDSCLQRTEKCLVEYSKVCSTTFKPDSTIYDVKVCEETRLDLQETNGTDIWSTGNDTCYSAFTVLLLCRYWYVYHACFVSNAFNTSTAILHKHISAVLRNYQDFPPFPCLKIENMSQMQFKTFF